MERLKESGHETPRTVGKHLHSSMERLKVMVLSRSPICSFNLHSSMERLKDDQVTKAIMLVEFTFQYGEIKSGNHSLTGSFR